MVEFLTHKIEIIGLSFLLSSCVMWNKVKIKVEKDGSKDLILIFQDFSWKTVNYLKYMAIKWRDFNYWCCLVHPASSVGNVVTFD